MLQQSFHYSLSIRDRVPKLKSSFSAQNKNELLEVEFPSHRAHIFCISHTNQLHYNSRASLGRLKR
jgi:hypothetical protein